MLFYNKIVYSFFGICLLCFLFYLRFSYIFRQPVYIVFPLAIKIIIILLFFFIVFSLISYFLFRSIFGFSISFTTRSEKVNEWIMFVLDKMEIVALALKNLHISLGLYIKQYGVLCNFFNTLFQYGGLVKYPFIYILIFSFCPTILLVSILFLELSLRMQVYYAFYCVPLLLLPILGKIILLITIDFITKNKQNLKNQIDFVIVSEDNTKKNNDFFQSNEFHAFLRKNELTLFQIIKNSESKFSLNVQQIYYCYQLFLTFENNLQNLYTIYSKFDQFISLFRYLSFIFLIIFLLLKNIQFL